MISTSASMSLQVLCKERKTNLNENYYLISGLVYT